MTSASSSTLHGRRAGGCDILVNNAGMEKEADFWEVTEADYDKVLAVNLKGPFFLTQYFVQKLLAANKPGRIINISSVHEDMVFPHFSTYCVSKGGIRMLMRDLAVELGPKNITVNNIAPGAISTPINASLLNNKTELDALLKNIPLGRLGYRGRSGSPGGLPGIGRSCVHHRIYLCHRWRSDPELSRTVIVDRSARRLVFGRLC